VVRQLCKIAAADVIPSEVPMTSKEVKELHNTAQAVADLIRHTNTDVRGDLLACVADKLVIDSQYYTAKVIRIAAAAYGISAIDVS
jgi:hypothetical protein